SRKAITLINIVASEKGMRSNDLFLIPFLGVRLLQIIPGNCRIPNIRSRKHCTFKNIYATITRVTTQEIPVEIRALQHFTCVAGR
ncbi:MAG: hypothetical protein ACSW8A_10435, partial [Lachnospiraceae bacterium]